MKENGYDEDKMERKNNDFASIIAVGTRVKDCSPCCDIPQCIASCCNCALIPDASRNFFILVLQTATETS